MTILGYRPEEMVGRNAKGFVYPDDLDSTREEMRLSRRGRLTRNFECRYVRKSGRVVPLAWTGVWSEPEQQHFFIGRERSTPEPTAPSGYCGANPHRLAVTRLSQHPVARHVARNLRQASRHRVEPSYCLSQ